MRTLLKLSPLLLPFGLLFAGGLALAVAQSLGFMLPIAAEGPWYASYTRLLEPHYLESFAFSVYVGFVSASVSVALGTILAYGLWKLPHSLQRAATVYKVPLILPHIAVAFMVLVFWTKSGFFASVAHHLGFIDAPQDFPSVVYGGTGLGIIMAYVYKETPFVILLAWAALRRFDPGLVSTAAMLGASRARIFLRVVLPHLMPVVHTTFIILFLYSFGAFEVPFLIGESSPAMLSIEAYNLYFQRDLSNRPAAMAILVLMFAFSALFIVLYARLTRRMQGRERKL